MSARLVIATHNPGKLREFQSLLAPLGIEATSAGALGLPEPDETASDFAGNARLKALAAASAAGLPALADDSGFCAAALDGGPGVLSSRYAAGDYPAAFARIIAAARTADEWRAWFTCALCLAQPNGTTQTYIGLAHGRIAQTPRGQDGFGYDPLFIPDGHIQTYAELGHAAKENISHRAAAVAQLMAALHNGAATLTSA
ncbi:RdgB/HAM1 family non-canonical purine NTP pyrophosphatase [Acidocella sp.]|uniref:RdgB/HAM1 family non-canonical purine NTP pyrophosphatase n=1 Tax=Acidocella sp. TaxID=50710 RepID=UPI00261D21CB|nr:RdgB/HAM1 family non-canonical purine NTP pyrophosphatase [Acidocella sp.]